MDMSEEAYLEHYGVKGMKWGVRRAQRKAEIAAKRQEFVDMAKKNPNKYMYIQAQNKQIIAKGKDFTDILKGKDGRMSRRLMEQTLKIAVKEQIRIDRKEARKEARRQARQTRNEVKVGSSTPRDLQSRSQRRR